MCGAIGDLIIRKTCIFSKLKLLLTLSSGDKRCEFLIGHTYKLSCNEAILWCSSTIQLLSIQI